MSVSLPHHHNLFKLSNILGRAAAAPAIRRLFASSPRDPRYHMLEHLSSKFVTPPQPSLLEPRAALILNRFTRTLTVMYATDAVSSILGVTPDELKNKSFYECIQENCLPDAIRCLESAKANDSIAYLRFWYRDPRREENFDEEMRQASQSSDSEDGGVDLNVHMDIDRDSPVEGSGSGLTDQRSSGVESTVTTTDSPNHLPKDSRTSSGEITDLEPDAPHPIFDTTRPSLSSNSSLLVLSPNVRRRGRPTPVPRPSPVPYELEAVVSCTSDGLVVILRRARHAVPSLQPIAQGHPFANGLFAAPWGANPIRPHQWQPDPQFPFQHGLQAPQVRVGGPPIEEFMTAIRDVAVFAWSLAGINGNIASYGRGVPHGEAQPPGGLPVWNPYAQPSPGYFPPENQAARKWAALDEKRKEPADFNMAPYQHTWQAQNLRPMSSDGSGPMGFDHPASIAQTRIRPHIAHAYQPQFETDYDHSHDQVHAQDGWSGSPLPEDTDNQQKTEAKDAQGPTEGARENRYLWF